MNSRMSQPAAAGNVHAQYVHRGLIKMSTLRDGLEKLRYDAVIMALLL